MKNNITTFYIVRHGETDWNVQRRIQGQTDIPLNENGKIQARNVAKKLQKVTFDLAFSSDLLRAKETAEIIALEHKVAVESTKLLRERVFGHLEGKVSTELRSYDELFDTLSYEQKFKFKMSDQAESDEELVSRVFTFLRETAIRYPGKNILTVSHGGIMRALLVHLGYLTYAQTKTHFMTNSGYIILSSDGVEFTIEKVNGLEKRDW